MLRSTGPLWGTYKASPLHPSSLYKYITLFVVHLCAGARPLPRLDRLLLPDDYSSPSSFSLSATFEIPPRGSSPRPFNRDGLFHSHTQTSTQLDAAPLRGGSGRFSHRHSSLSFQRFSMNRICNCNSSRNSEDTGNTQPARLFFLPPIAIRRECVFYRADM